MCAGPNSVTIVTHPPPIKQRIAYTVGVGKLLASCRQAVGKLQASCRRAMGADMDHETQSVCVCVYFSRRCHHQPLPLGRASARKPTSSGQRAIPAT